MYTKSVYYLQDFLKDPSSKLQEVKPTKVTQIGQLKLTKSQTRRLELIQISLLRNLLRMTGEIIKVVDATTHQHIILLGSIEFRINKTSQLIESYIWPFGYGNLDYFKHVNAKSINICKPLQLTQWLKWHLIKSVSEEIYAIENNLFIYFDGWNERDELCKIEQNIEAILINWLERNFLRKFSWNKLRLAARQVLNLNPFALLLACQTKLSAKSTVRLSHYNQALENLDAYEEVHRDNPKLLWVLSLLIQEGHAFNQNVIASMRKILIDAGILPIGWRVLAKTHKREFGFILESKKAYENLIDYLRLHVILKRHDLIPKSLNHLFIHPYWDVKNGLVIYRGAKFKPALFNKLIQRLCQANDKTEIYNEISVVIYWLKEFEPKIDHVQLKKPWQWFANKASQQINEELMRLKNSKITWDPIIRHVEVDGFQFVAIESLWQLMQLAVNQRHCIDVYGDNCVAGNLLVFTVTKANKIAATVLLCKYENCWELKDVRGFANATVDKQITFVTNNFINRLNKYSKDLGTTYKTEMLLKAA